MQVKVVVSQVKPPQQPSVLLQSAPRVLGPTQEPSVSVGIDVSEALGIDARVESRLGELLME